MPWTWTPVDVGVGSGYAHRTKDDLKQAAFNSLGKGRKQEFLPDGFSFRGKDNSVLDGINEYMSLRP